MLNKQFLGWEFFPMFFANPLSAMHLPLMIDPVVPGQILLVRVLAVWECADIWSQISENVPSVRRVSGVKVK